ncbi:MAG: hypothetical protein R3E79_32890 [Caldilineaceae bacterium]
MIVVMKAEATGSEVDAVMKRIEQMERPTLSMAKAALSPRRGDSDAVAREVFDE